MLDTKRCFICGDDEIGCLCEAWLPVVFIGHRIVCTGLAIASADLRDKRLQEAKRHEDMLNKLEGRIASGRIILLNSNFRRMSPKNARLTRKKEAWNNSKIFRRGCQVCLVIFHTVDGSEIWLTSWYGQYPLYLVFTPSKLPNGGCLGFLNHQQHNGFGWWFHRSWLVNLPFSQRNPPPEIRPD